MLVQQYDHLYKIKTLKKHSFSQDMVEYLIGSLLNFLVLIITGLQFYHYYDGIDEGLYEYINITILDGNVINMSLIII